MHDRESRNVDSRGITERAIPWQRDVTYVTQYARCRLCRAICSDASLDASKPAHSTRLALSKERTSSAPALITARRRSYFTPRSSIIHAVNNAPLFRVTLYPGLLPISLSVFLPSFLPPLLSSIEGARVSRDMTRGRKVGVRAVSVRDALISRFIHRNEDTLRSARSRKVNSATSSLFDSFSRKVSSG